METLLKKNPVISHVVWLSKNKTTDEALARLKQRRQALSPLPADLSTASPLIQSMMAKQLVLTSPRNNHYRPERDNPLVAFSIEELSKGSQPVLTMTNFWFSSYVRLYNIGMAEKTASANLQHFVQVLRALRKLRKAHLCSTSRCRISDGGTFSTSSSTQFTTLVRLQPQVLELIPIVCNSFVLGRWSAAGSSAEVAHQRRVQRPLLSRGPA